ncbi:type 4a pilus biogenesis protein PilO [Candidatus Nitrotoga arctica]|uniref:type 4a pilus biogenesis protein PilO n=1 Tax=Candidatus Nitrotoga arctica TaxID=453162 RepID=UPI001EFB2FE3|nr:type 4a pilus biogenesis protein PilO [Candidatus Nitrotoga arctica]
MTVLLLGAVFDWRDRWEALSNAKQIETTLKTDFKTKKAIAINLDVINKKLTEARQSFDALLKQLPSKSEMDALLTDINQAGLGHGLQFELFRPGAEIITGVFAEQAITIKVTGNYDDIGKFASDIAQLPRIVSLSEISINPTGGHLTMDTIAKTYRYLDDEELTVQKQSSKTAGAHK